MAKRSGTPSRPTDTNRLAKTIVDLATGQAHESDAPAKNPAAVALGRMGGLKGGIARTKALSKRQLSAIGKKGAQGRWGKHKHHASK